MSSTPSHRKTITSQELKQTFWLPSFAGFETTTCLFTYLPAQVTPRAASFFRAMLSHAARSRSNWLGALVGCVYVVVQPPNRSKAGNNHHTLLLIAFPVTAIIFLRFSQVSFLRQLEDTKKWLLMELLKQKLYLSTLCSMLLNLKEIGFCSVCLFGSKCRVFPTKQSIKCRFLNTQCLSTFIFLSKWSYKYSSLNPRADLCRIFKEQVTTGCAARFSRTATLLWSPPYGHCKASVTKFPNNTHHQHLMNICDVDQAKLPSLLCSRTI